jgi:hypothetical protein
MRADNPSWQNRSKARRVVFGFTTIVAFGVGVGYAVDSARARVPQHCQ